MKPNLIRALRYTIFPLIASCIFLLHYSNLQAATQLSTQLSTTAPMPINALVELDVATIAEMEETITFIENQGGNIPLTFAPQALFVYIPPEVKTDSWDARTDILAVHQGLATLTTDDPQAQLAMTVWNQWQQEHPFALSQAAVIQASQNRAQQPHEQHEHDHTSLHEAIRSISDQAVKQANIQSTALADCSNLAANRFPNPNCFQTSEFFIGGTQVDLFLPESTIDSSNTENWSKTRRDEVVNGIASSLLWWVAASQQVDPAPELSYNLTVHDPFITPEDVATDHEPILTNAQIDFMASEDRLWIGEILENVGYPGSTAYEGVPSHMVAMWQYVDARRQEMMRDWGFVVFVADSQNQEDGFFADGRSFAYAGRPGPHVVLTYDNGPNSEQIGALNGIKVNMVHEMGHIIDAPEEYRDHCNPNKSSGYLHILNTNCESGGNLPLEDSVMRSPLNQRIAFTNLKLPMSIRRMAGWQDSDGDGILDPVDTTPMIVVQGPTQLSDGRYRYTGRATDIAFSVPSGRLIRTTRTPSTINTIVSAEYRLDNSPWRPCLFNGSELTHNASSGNFQCDFVSPAVGQHTLAFRARNSVGNYSDIVVQTIEIFPPSITDMPNLAPQGTLSLSGGDSNVLGSPTAHLILSASDDQSLLKDGGKYRLHYGGQWQDWVKYKGYAYLELDSQQVDHDLSVQYQDNAGNISQEYATMLKLDTKPPTCAIRDIRVDPDSTDVVLTFDNSDEESAISGTNLYYYDEDAERYQWQGWTREMTKTTVAIAENGIYNFTLRCRDQAYNQSQMSQPLTVDRTGPSGTIQKVDAVWDGGQIQATLHFAASDDLPGITSYRLYYGGQWHDWTTVTVAFTFAESALVTIDPGEDINYTFQIQFRDGSGNVSEIHRKDVEILNNAPVGSIQDIEKSWRGDELDATIYFTAKSTVGGINGYRFYYNGEWQAWEDVDITLALDDSTTTTLYPTNDTHQVQIQFRDAAGNMSKIYSRDIQVSPTDRRGPTGSLVIGTIEPLIQGLNETDGRAEVTLRISAQDRESQATKMNIFDGANWLGWEPIQATKQIEVNDGVYDFQIQFRDSVNNVSEIISQDSVIIDTIPPAGSIEVTTRAIADEVAQATIKLRIHNTESLGVLQMRLFYNDQWHSWEDYAATKTVTLERQGLQDFQAQFRDLSQNTSTIYTIPDHPVDTRPPIAWIVSPESGSTKVIPILVTWTGINAEDDSDSDIECYDVRYSIDEGATWTLWQDCVTATSAPLEGEVGKTYYIQVRARDNSGNIGEYPDVSDSITILVTGDDEEPPTSDTELYLPIVYWTTRSIP